MTEENNQQNNKKLPTSLSTRQKQFLKGIAHTLNPLVQIGHNGVNSGVIEMTRKELINRELIKIKIGTNSSAEKNETAVCIAEKTGSHIVQIIGKTIILFRENPKKNREEKIRLPKK